jgi:hypothetical protein
MQLAWERSEYTLVVGIPKRKGPLGRAIRKWKDTIKINHREVGWGM